MAFDLTAYNPTLLAALAMPNNIDYAGRISSLLTQNTQRQQALQDIALKPAQVQNQTLNTRAALLAQGYDIGPDGKLKPTPFMQNKLNAMKNYQDYLASTGGQGGQAPMPSSDTTSGGGQMQVPSQPLQRINNAIQGGDANDIPSGVDSSNFLDSNQAAPLAETPISPIGQPGGALASLAQPVSQRDIMTSPEVRAAYGLGDITQVPNAINQATQRLQQEKQLGMQATGVEQKQQEIAQGQQKVNIERNANIQKANESNGRPTQFDTQGSAILDNRTGKTPEFPFPAPIMTKERIADSNKNYEKVIEKDQDNLTDVPKALQVLKNMQANANQFRPGFLGDVRKSILTGTNYITGDKYAPAEVEAANNLMKLPSQFVSVFQKIDPGTGSRGTNMNISLTQAGKPDINTPAASFNDIINGFQGELTREYNSGLLRQTFKSANPNGIITPDVTKLDNAINTLYPLQTVDKSTGKIVYNEGNAAKVQQLITDGSVISRGPDLIKAAAKGKPAADATIGANQQNGIAPEGHIVQNAAGQKMIKQGGVWKPVQ